MMVDLANQVRARLPEVKGLGWSRGTDLRVTPILNWGGFANHSFKASDGEFTFHVKLADDPESLRGLQRWRRLGDTLAHQYSAPGIRGWISIEGTPFAGLVFEWIQGDSPDRMSPALLTSVSERIAALHRDRRLGVALGGMGDRVRSCARAYEASFHDRFMEDLKGIRAEPPPFLTTPVLDWMGAEVAVLLDHVHLSRAFEESADAPSHQDLWLNNLIVTPSGHLHILDWDGLALGDPIMDWAMLVGPAPSDLRVADARDLPGLPFPRAELQRFELYARASLLDWVIDPLADWVEAPASEHRDRTRAVKQRTHEQALDSYRVAFG